MTSFLCVGLIAGPAGAQEPTPTPPPVPPAAVGPQTVQPPPPPMLPKDDKGDHKGKKGGGKHKGGKHRGGKSGKRGGKDKADALKASCGGFSLVQTYTTWGPALSYGRPVTVSYDATRCSEPDGRSLDLSVQGTATVSEVAEAGGAVIEAVPFQVTGTWRRPGNDSGWPPSWWECGVRFAEYTWEIPGIYTFHVAATEGSWTLDVNTGGPTPKTISWAYDAC